MIDCYSCEMWNEIAPKLSAYLEKIRQGKATEKDCLEFVLLKKERVEECRRRHPGKIIELNGYGD